MMSVSPVQEYHFDLLGLVIQFVPIEVIPDYLGQRARYFIIK